jgi:CheY-like chemotaxis protein
MRQLANQCVEAIMSNRLQAAARPAAMPCRLPPDGSAETAQACRAILLVEDDDQVRQMVSRTLTSLGHKIIEARDGESALNALSRNPTVDCLFSDVIMPNGMNGVQLVQRARIARPDLRAILTSVRPRDEVRALGHLPLDIAFIPKPYALTDISSMLRYGSRKPGRPAAMSRRWFSDRHGNPFVITTSAHPADAGEGEDSDQDRIWEPE